MQRFVWKSSDGATLAGYQEDSEQEPKAVLCLIHGLGEHAGRFNDIICSLNSASIAVLAMDLRGHGLSSGKRGHVAPRKLVLDDVDDLIREARVKYPGLPIWLFGHSLGGNIVLSHRLLKREAVSGIIVSAPWLKLAKPLPDILMPLIKFLASIAPSFSVNNGIDAAGLSHNRHVMVEYQKDTRVHSLISMRSLLDALQMADAILDGANEMKGPILMLQGGADPLCAVSANRKFAESAGSECIYREWEGMLHELHHENVWPEEAKAIADFILGREVDSGLYIG